MKVYRITASDYAGDLSGNGARLFGGRWNSKGKYALYTSENRSLALMENLVHMPFKFLQTKSYSLIEFTVPDEAGVLHLDVMDLPVHWNAWASSPVSRKIGDDFLDKQQHLALRVPSAVMPEEFNYILNPLHPAIKQVEITARRTVRFDDRLLRAFQNQTGRAG